MQNIILEIYHYIINPPLYSKFINMLPINYLSTFLSVSLVSVLYYEVSANCLLIFMLLISDRQGLFITFFILNIESQDAFTQEI